MSFNILGLLLKYPPNLDHTGFIVTFVNLILMSTLYCFSYREYSTNKGLMMIVNPAFMKYVHDGWLGRKGQYPSTGFMTLVLAIHMCEEVHVFGFGADHNGNWNHYWEELLNKKLRTGNHNGHQEYSVILKLAQTQKVKFYSGY